MDSGIYYFELDNTGNIRIKTNEKIALKSRIDFSGDYYIYLMGKIPHSKIKVYSGRNKLTTNEIFIPIKLEKGKLTISITPENNETLYLDQILLIPQKYSYIVRYKNDYFLIKEDGISSIKYEEKILKQRI
ncbi:hypothetical protein [Marinitoga lauensis]|uniref:hypothetical protein n=1 Tax=Marinitoga lauensis TaxID=2201189 RepID=UPI001012DAAE|nr:hypothetical protein [Marinitoga lauensis]